MDGFVSISEFEGYLKSQNLIIVSRHEYETKIDFEEATLKKAQQNLLRKKAVRFKDVVDYKLLPVGHKTTIFSWIKSGRIRDWEVVEDDKGVKHLLSATIKRLNPNL